mmetsp:Transcript_21645/g.42284  ORF Transcript_21645/g.42284 Transcript_21645/m.42284 type:complete len:208 (-) Transcript_21645:156-779(-)
MDGTVLHAHGNATKATAIIAHDEIECEVFHEEEAIKLQSHAVKCVQDRMTSAICCCSTAVCLATLSKFQTLATKCTLIDLAIRRPREGQTKRFKFQDHFWRQTAHVLNGILVSKPVGTLDGVVSMPTPVIFCHVGKGPVDTTLCSYGVRARGEDFADACCLQSVPHESSSCTKAGATGSNDNRIIAVVENLITADLRGCHGTFSGSS